MNTTWRADKDGIVSKRVLIIVAGILAAGAAATTALLLTRQRAGSPQPVAAAYLSAWDRDDWTAMTTLVENPPADFASVHQQTTRDLHVSAATHRLGPIKTSGGRAHATFTARLELRGLGAWEYAGQLDLHHQHGAWRVVWSLATVHPDLRPGLRLERTRTWARRALIQGTGGTRLTLDATAVSVGVEPGRVTDRAGLVAALQQTLHVDPAAITARLSAPGLRPDAFIPVGELTEDRYTQLRPVLFPVPGVVFQRHAAHVAATADLEAHVVGQVGPITAELLGRLGPPYDNGDQVGLSGLEAGDERQLAGTPSGEVDVADGAGHVVSILQRFTGRAPQPVSTTLDLTVQRAAERALDAVTQPAALVAVQASTGEIRAVISRPTAVPFDRALDGRYPPGSTAKVITATALLELGTTPDQSVSCPPQLTVQGKRFTNFEGEAAPTLSFLQAFALSCNTAFVGLASRLTPQELTATAGQFGFGVEPHIGVPAVGGRFPTPTSRLEQVADAIGQGRVDASPLTMAGVAAAADTGTWHPLVLVPPASAAATASSAASSAAASPAPLDPRVVAALHQLMAQVVTSGTGTAAAVPGAPPVLGKTGTAEFGSANPPSTHAWFIGFRGDLAFAVLVEGGGVGGRVAAPIAARFLSDLALAPVPSP